MPSIINPRSVSLNLTRAETDNLWFNQGRRLAIDFASLFGVEFTEPASGVQSQLTQGSSNTLAFSTFSGFGSEIGIRQNFDCLKFSVFPFVEAELPTQCRVTLREATHDGTILANVIQPMSSVQFNTPYQIFAELGSVIENSGSSELYLQVWTDGRIGYGAAGENPTAENVRYRTNKGISTQTGGGLVVTPYGEIFAKSYLCGTTNVFTNGVFSSHEFISSTFSGWGSVMSSVPPEFNFAQLWLNAFDADRLPTKVRIRFRDTSYSGTVLATATANVAFSSTGSKLVSLFFDQDIDLSGYATVWLEVVTDGYVSMPKSDTSSGSSTEKYAANGGIDSSVGAPVVGANGRQIWIRTTLQDRSAGVTFDSGQLLRAIQKQTAEMSLPTADILFPNTIFAIENYESNIYIDGAVDSTVPTEALRIRGGTSAISSGKMETHRFVYTPSGTGSHGVAFYVDYNGNTIQSDSTTLSYKAESVGDGQSRKALIIGDSITAGGVISTTVLADVAANGDSSYALTLLGTQGTGAALHEGYGGYTYGTFCTTGPFYNSGFDFDYYMTNNAYSMSAGDSVFLMLGTNDFFQQDDDDAMATQMATVATYLDSIITSVHAYESGINIWIGMIPQPAYGQTAWGQTYGGTAYIHSRIKRNFALWRRFLITVYDGLGVSDKVWLCPVHCCVDTKNNYTQSARDVNGRNTTQETIQSDPVHPATSGRQQIGDTLYACLMSLES